MIRESAAAAAAARDDDDEYEYGSSVPRGGGVQRRRRRLRAGGRKAQVFFSSSQTRRTAAAAAARILLLILLSFAAVAPSEGSFAVTVGSGDEVCYVVRAPGNEMSIISGNFDCLDDGLDPDPIRVTLYDPDGKRAWQSEDGEPEGTFAVRGRGRHQLCIVNGHGANPPAAAGGGDDDEDSGDGPDGARRTVGFGVRVRPLPRGGDTEKKTPDEEGPDTERTERLLDLADDLNEDLNDLRDHQDYLKLREAAHRELTERTFTRVVRWTVLEALVLMGVAGGQVAYLRKFFEQRRYL